MRAVRSFTLRLVAWFVVLAIAPAGAMAYLAYDEIRDTGEANVVSHLRTVALARAAALAGQAAQADVSAMGPILEPPEGLGRSARVFLTESGVVLTGPGKGRRWSAKEGVAEDSDGVEVLTAWAPAGNRRVVAQTERAEAAAPLYALAARLLAIGAVSFVVVIFGLVLLARRVERSTSEMVESLRDAARGEFGSQVGKPPSGPARDLARALNEMQSRLAEREAQVVRQRQELICQQCELEKLNTQIRAADQIKSEFVANMSHEVRTPLHAVLSLSRVLLDERSGRLNEEQRRQVGIIERNGKTLLAMLGDILDFSKIEAGRMDAVVSDVAPGGVLAAVREAILPLAQDKGLEIRLDAGPELPTIRTDGEKLHRALLNLAHNAVKFTPAGRIELGASAGPDGGVEFSVRDTGVGIPKAKIPTVFEAFRQVDSSATRAAGGTGLGLTITQSIVDLLGGRIAVESEPGVGTTFTLSLPKDPDFAPQARVLVLGATQPACEAVWLGLRAAGFRGEQAVCGREARSALRQSGVRAIAVDLGILERDGLEILGGLADVDAVPAMIGYWIDAARERGGYVGRLSIRSDTGGGRSLHVDGRPPLVLPDAAPTASELAEARAWGRAAAAAPGEPVELFVRLLVRGTDDALRNRVAV